MLPTFETTRLILKPRTIDDLDNCIEMDITPQVTEYIPGEWNGSHRHIAFLKERILKTYPKGLGYWSIFLKDNPTRFLGWIHLLPVQDDRQATEIGWRLMYSAWGNGYATEAARAIIAYTFKKTNFSRIVAYTHYANNRSIKMMDRLGFKYIADFMYDGKTPSLSYEIREKSIIESHQI